MLFENGNDGSNQAVLAQVFLDVQALASEVAPGCSVHGRLKSDTSRLRKVLVAGLAGRTVLDSIGVRVVVDNLDQCYHVMDLVHGRFNTLAHEYDDYIEHPKPNGYRSLHATIVTRDGHPVEVQVRTREMHAVAEDGPAAHRLYKEGQVRSARSARRTTGRGAKRFVGDIS